MSSPLSAVSQSSWYAVCCKPRQEAVAQDNLVRQGYSVYLPRLRTKKRRGGKFVTALEALFPRYLFVRVNRERQSTASIRSTRGAVGLVRFGSEPAVVPDPMIDAIMAREDNDGIHGDPRLTFRPGDRVTMIDGPLAGLDGIFAREDGDERAALLVDLLGKTNRIRVDSDWIVPSC